MSVIAVEGLGDHPLLEDYRDLREADLAARRRAFIAESEVVLRVQLSRGRFPLRSILLAASKHDKLADALVGLDADIPVFLAEQSVLNEVVGFRIHRGVLAACERESVPAAGALLDEIDANLVVVLEGLTNHDNVGGVFRNAAAFGADAVLYDAATCDPLYRKAIRVSVGAALFVPFARRERSIDIAADLAARGYHQIALSPAGALEIAELRRPLPQRLALWLGTEGAGLSRAALDAVDEVARIDMAPGFDSLNVATASGLALHAIRTLRRGRG